MTEETTFRDISHQQLDNHREFVNRLIETRSGGRRRSMSDSLLNICMSGGVVQLDGLDTTKVVVIASILWVTCGGWECGL